MSAEHVSSTTPSSVHGWSHSKCTGNPALGNGRSRRTTEDDDALRDDHDAGPERGEQSLTAEGERRRRDTASATAPQTQPISTALATVARITVGTPTASAAQRDGGKGRGTGTGTSRVAVAATIGDDQDDAGEHAEERGERGRRSRSRCAVQWIVMVVGSSVGSMNQPFALPSTSVGGPSDPVASDRRPRRVVSLTEHDPASLGTRRHLDRPTGPRRRGDRDGRERASRRRPRRRPARPARPGRRGTPTPCPGSTCSVCVPAASASTDDPSPAHTVASIGAPRRIASVDAVNDKPTGVPSTWQQVVAALLDVIAGRCHARSAAMMRRRR